MLFLEISLLFRVYPDFSGDYRTFPKIHFDILKIWKLFRTFLWKRGFFQRKGECCTCTSILILTLNLNIPFSTNKKNIKGFFINFLHFFFTVEQLHLEFYNHLATSDATWEHVVLSGLKRKYNISLQFAIFRQNFKFLNCVRLWRNAIFF